MFGKKGMTFGLVFVTVLSLGTGLLGAGPALAQGGASYPGKDALAIGIAVNDGPQGAIVEQVAPGSAAARAGLAVDDVITAVDGHPVDAAYPLADLLKGAEPEGGWLLTVQRGSQVLSITIEPDLAGSKSAPIGGPRHTTGGLSALLGHFSFSDFLNRLHSAFAASPASPDSTGTSGQSLQAPAVKGWLNSLLTPPRPSNKVMAETRGS
jgi:membrane-associated protease RseP (regulator of RpoE activity)